MTTAGYTLVADVGGTNTRVAASGPKGVDEALTRKYRNEGFADLGQLLSSYLAEPDIPAVDAVCVAVAGPVHDGIGKMTNLDWTITPALLKSATGAARCFVINDLEAQGYALDDVGTRAVAGPAKAAAASPRLVVGVGTGFNAAPVHDTPRGRLVAASECGHISLPVWDGESHRLAEWLAADHDFASVEEALSGRGLENLYAFAQGIRPEQAKDSTAILASVDTDPASRRAVTLFCQIFARLLGDFALIHLPWGGIYLIGGMARAMAPHFEAASFHDHFCDKGRFSDFVRDFTVHLVEDDFAALAGCARYVEQTA